MGIWEWVTAVLAIWGAVSILLAVGWAVVGRRIFRKPPPPPVPSGPRIIGKPSRVELNGVDLTPYLRSESGEQR